MTSFKPLSVLMAALLAMALAPLAAKGQELPQEEARLEVRQMLLAAQDALQAGDDQGAMSHIFDALYNMTNIAEIFVTTAELTREPAQRFGQYTPREHNAYAPGEPIHLYLEPLGMDFHRRDDGRAAANVQVGYKLKDSNGELVREEKNFLTADFIGRTIAFDNFITVTYRFGELDQGRYTLETILTDGHDGSRLAVETELLIHGGAVSTRDGDSGGSGPSLTGGGSLTKRLFGGD